MSAETFDGYASRVIAAEAVRLYRKAVEAAAEKGEIAGAFQVNVGDTMRAVIAARAKAKAARIELTGGRCPMRGGMCPITRKT